MSLAEQAAAHPFLAAFMPRDLDAHASLDSVLAGQARVGARVRVGVRDRVRLLFP